MRAKKRRFFRYAKKMITLVKSGMKLQIMMATSMPSGNIASN